MSNGSILSYNNKNFSTIEEASEIRNQNSESERILTACLQDHDMTSSATKQKDSKRVKKEGRKENKENKPLTKVLIRHDKI